MKNTMKTAVVLTSVATILVSLTRTILAAKQYCRNSKRMKEDSKILRFSAAFDNLSTEVFLLNSEPVNYNVIKRLNEILEIYKGEEFQANVCDMKEKVDELERLIKAKTDELIRNMEVIDV